MTTEEAKKFGLQLLHGIMERNESYPVYANNVKQAIDALSEESNSSEIPNDLEKAAKKSASQYYVDGGYSPFPNVETAAHEAGFIAGAEWQKEKTAWVYLKEAKDAVIALEKEKGEPLNPRVAFVNGARWQKQQMLEKAVETSVYGCGDEMTPEIAVELSADYKPGDKVRVIVIKEN